uniref:SF-assemblin n=1 Tax=Prymnesium polylepis TaxID=72548 RepID=A0A6V4UDE8_9EUKA|mmetsp:Transcript_25661/g.68581  ORF Transcript_25661/g.68581 Transcript_25661/m.68581 type:complete len:277 (+) Transcript_25661:92-922(+)
MATPAKHADTKSIAASTTASRKTTGSNRSVSGRLNAMADDFNNFYGDLEEETTIRKKAEEDRVARMEREIGKIEKVLGTETKRRIEASKALQTMFENKITRLQQDFKEELRQVFEPLQTQIDTLVQRVEDIEKTMADEKRDREKEIQRANKEILDKFSIHQKQFEVEKVTRLQREAQVLKRVGDEVFRMQQKVTAERASREAAIVLMKDDFMAAHKAREKADEIFKGEMLRKMAVVEKDLEVETKNREASEEQLVNALNDYTQALQDGLRIVNRAT